MQLEEAVTFIWKDRKWLEKTAVGVLFTLLSLVLVGIPFLSGYWIQAVRQAARGPVVGLPEWTDLGRKFSEGLAVVLIIIGWQITPWMLQLLTSGLSGLLDARFQDNVGVAFLVLCMQCVGLLINLVFWVGLTAGLIRYAESERLAQAFNLAGIVALLRRRGGRFLAALLLSWVLTFLGLFGLALCFVGIFLTVFWSQMILANLYGQVVRPEVAEPEPAPAPAA